MNVQSSRKQDSKHCRKTRIKIIIIIIIIIIRINLNKRRQPNLKQSAMIKNTLAHSA